MNKTMVVGLTAALLVGCGEPKSQQENRLAITQQNVSGAWQCDYKLTDIKLRCMFLMEKVVISVVVCS